MRKTRLQVLAAALAAAAVLGCSSDAGVKWPDLHPVKGVVRVGGKTASGGSIRFASDDTTLADFASTGTVGTDGAYTLATSHAHDKKGQRRDGAPAGKYKVTYTPPYGDQTGGTGGDGKPIDLGGPVTVAAGNNDLPIDLPVPTKKK